MIQTAVFGIIVVLYVYAGRSYFLISTRESLKRVFPRTNLKCSIIFPVRYKTLVCSALPCFVKYDCALKTLTIQTVPSLGGANVLVWPTGFNGWPI